MRPASPIPLYSLRFLFVFNRGRYKAAVLSSGLEYALVFSLPVTLH